jgi:hypothetical protein
MLTGRRLQGLVVLLALGGCSNTTNLFHRTVERRAASTSTRTTSTTTTTPSAQSVYLAQLGAAQAQLGAAEKQIPTSPRTPAALARSIELLAGAVRRLADGLAAIKPPPSVATRHAQLAAIMHRYAAQLQLAQRIALTPGGESRAGSLLISATDSASRAFTATIAAIDSTLGRSPA